MRAALNDARLWGIRSAERAQRNAMIWLAYTRGLPPHYIAREFGLTDHGDVPGDSAPVSKTVSGAPYEAAYRFASHAWEPRRPAQRAVVPHPSGYGHRGGQGEKDADFAAGSVGKVEDHEPSDQDDRD